MRLLLFLFGAVTTVTSCAGSLNPSAQLNVNPSAVPTVFVLGERPDVRSDGRTIILTARHDNSPGQPTPDAARNQTPLEEPPTLLPDPITTPLSLPPYDVRSDEMSDKEPFVVAPPAQGRVIVIGDSLTVGAEPFLDDLFTAAKIPYVISAYPGVPAGWAVTQLDETTPTEDDLVIIALGTNDSVSNPNRFASQVNEIADRVPGVVVWLTLDRPGDEQLNQVLRDAASSRANMLLADWERLADTNPRWRAVDQVHYSYTGYQARAEFVVRVVQSLI